MTFSEKHKTFSKKGGRSSAKTKDQVKAELASVEEEYQKALKDNIPYFDRMKLVEKRNKLEDQLRSFSPS